MNFYNLQNLSNPLITKIEAYCYGKNSLQKIDDKRIVVGGRDTIHPKKNYFCVEELLQL